MENPRRSSSVRGNGSKNRLSRQQRPCRNKNQNKRFASVPTKRGPQGSDLKRSLFQLDNQNDRNLQEDISTSIKPMDFETSLLENPFYTEFLTKVNCSFCLKTQKNKTHLIKHLDEVCRSKKKRIALKAIFQILPTNSIKCNVCPNTVLGSITGYFLHLHSENHNLKCSEAMQAKKLTDFLYCSCCKIFVPNNHTQLSCHLENEIHDVRRKSLLNSRYFLSRGFYCIYCFYNTKRCFKCLVCPPPEFLFYTPLEIISHLKDSKHLRNNKKNFISLGVYCCFCDEEVLEHEIQYHFLLEDHKKFVREATPTGDYDLCLFCGFSCSTLKDFLSHMRSKCSKINDLRQEKGWKIPEDKTENRNGEEAVHKKTAGETSAKNERCISVRGNFRLEELMKKLRLFGKIVSIQPQHDGDLVVEFKDESAIELISLAQGFIKSDAENLDIKFLEGQEGTEL